MADELAVPLSERTFKNREKDDRAERSLNTAAASGPSLSRTPGEISSHARAGQQSVLSCTTFGVSRCESFKPLLHLALP